jgi:hypothetical protein
MSTATKERPILFSGEMVKAILEGRKTQTRRVIKPQPGDKPSWAAYGPYSGPGGWHWIGENDSGQFADSWPQSPIACPYSIGDRLWVKETWRPILSGIKQGGFDYKADDPSASGIGFIPWKSGRFMPRWASRITLEITAVRPERLQAISEEDAAAEGFEFFVGPKESVGCFWNGPGYWDGFSRHSLHGGKTYHAASRNDARCGCNVGQAENLTPARCAFRHLWDHLNAKRGYLFQANPWVWVISFRKVSQ